MTGSVRNSEFCFPNDLNVSFGFASGNVEGLRETKPVIKCLLINQDSQLLTNSWGIFSQYCKKKNGTQNGMFTKIS